MFAVLHRTFQALTRNIFQTRLTNRAWPCKSNNQDNSGSSEASLAIVGFRNRNNSRRRLHRNLCVIWLRGNDGPGISLLNTVPSTHTVPRPPTVIVILDSVYVGGRPHGLVYPTDVKAAPAQPVIATFERGRTNTVRPMQLLLSRSAWKGS